MGRRGRRSIFSCVRTGVAALGLAVFGGAGVAYGQDVVTTTSGDRLVGEIKRVEKDVLTLRDRLFGRRLQDRVGRRRRRSKANDSSWWRPSTEGVCRAR